MKCVLILAYSLLQAVYVTLENEVGLSLTQIEQKQSRHAYLTPQNTPPAVRPL